MALKCSLIILFVFAVVVTLADNVDPQPPITILPPVNTSTTTAKPLPPKTTTVEPTPPPTPVPTKPPTTTTTKAPTPAPVTTTKAPTPPPTPTPTTPAPAPTPSPAPPSPPTDWVIHGENGTVCVLAHMSIKLDVPYTSTVNKSLTSTFKIDHVSNATATGQCGNDSQSLTLKWIENNITSSFFFVQNATAKTYSLNKVEINIPVNNVTFPNITVGNISTILFTHGEEVFSRNLKNSFTCANVKPLNLIGTHSINGTLSLSNAHVEAFGEGKNATYSQGVDCVASILTPDIVPIVVGLILAGLVVFVLIAYLVGRHRAQSRGYLSM